MRPHFHRLVQCRYESCDLQGVWRLDIELPHLKRYGKPRRLKTYLCREHGHALGGTWMSTYVVSERWYVPLEDAHRRDRRAHV